MLDKSKSSVQDTKSTRNQTKRVHHRIEQACSRIETVYVFRLFTHIEPKVSSGKQVRCSNLAHRTEGSVGQHFRTELNECLSVEQIQCSN